MQMRPQRPGLPAATRSLAPRPLDSEESSSGRPRAEKTSIWRRLIARPELGPFVLLLVEVTAFWAINHEFLSPQNISNTLAFTVELGLIALAMVFWIRQYLSFPTRSG